MTANLDRAGSDTPFYSANDRSRWATIRALGDDETYIIDSVIFADEEIRWDTIDKVRHLGEDGKFHFYSSKPPLMPTILSGLYRVVHQFTGWTLRDDTSAVVRTMMLLFNGGGWFLFLYFCASLINAIPVRDWTRYYVLACAGFGTFLSTFAISLNNHLPAAICVMAALYYVAEIWRREQAPSWMYALCGLFSSLAVANELPALSFLAFAGLFCLLKSYRQTLTSFLVPILLVTSGFFYTNYLAHGTFSPAYAHRSDGNVEATATGAFADELNDGRFPKELQEVAKNAFEFSLPVVEQDGWPSTPDEINRWVVRDQIGSTQFAIQNVSGSDEYTIHAWKNWYDYPNSYWSKTNDAKKSEVDRGQASIEVYAFHLFFGHHGIFSLTPIWLLAFAGMVALAGGIKLAGRFQMKWLGWMALAITAAVILFYLRRPEMDRNYGGVTSGLRWVFWLAPIWLACMLPVVDWLASSKWGKAVCYVLLLASILSAGYSADNPWVQPWLYEIWDLTGIDK
ncbi:MAG: hypothetical protein AAFN77_04285 [Planctomycetota bacterium]